MHSWHRHHECDPSEHFAIFLCTERERQRNSETMMQKSSQTNPIKKHTQNLSFDKFDRIRINFVHMKSISVEASRYEKKERHWTQTRSKMIVVVIFLLEKRRNIKSVTFKRQQKCIEIAFEPLFGNCNTSIWILDCVHFLHWAGGIYAESREKKRQTNEQNISRVSKTFYNFISFYLCSGCISTHLPASMLIHVRLCWFYCVRTWRVYMATVHDMSDYLHVSFLSNMCMRAIFLRLHH